MSISLPIHGRGAAINPPNRFEPIVLEPETDADHCARDDDDPPVSPTTQFFRDSTRSIISHNDSPDVGFEFSINPYRGCEHGCVYCYARPGHEYLGFSSGLDFETKIMVKVDAPLLLRKELMSPKWQPKSLSFSGVTDCYQPAERRFRITRRCLEVLAEFRNPCSIITKNHLVTRDIDLLAEMARESAAAVFVSITTLDHDLGRVMEPRTSVPRRRLEAIRKLSDAGIPVGVMCSPMIPGLNDHEMPAILSAAADAGARTAGFIVVRLPYAIKDLFEDWLTRHFPDRRDKVLNRIRAIRGGKLNDPDFHTRMRGQGVWAEQLQTMFDLAKRKAELDQPFPALSTAAFRRPPAPQMTLW